MFWNLMWDIMWLLHVMAKKWNALFEIRNKPTFFKSLHNTHFFVERFIQLWVDRWDILTMWCNKHFQFIDVGTLTNTTTSDVVAPHNLSIWRHWWRIVLVTEVFLAPEQLYLLSKHVILLWCISLYKSLHKHPIIDRCIHRLFSFFMQLRFVLLHHSIDVYSKYSFEEVNEFHLSEW
jgi:hypothetical protein